MRFKDGIIEIDIVGEITFRENILSFFGGSVTIEGLMSFINYHMKTEKVKGIHMTIDSPGGSVAGADKFFDFLKSLNVPITARVDGFCASAATVLLLAADKREAKPFTNFMIHGPGGFTRTDED